MADDKYNTGAAPIDQVIADLQRRVAILEQSPRLQNASIDAGGLTVKGGAIRVTDPNGVVQVLLGKQADGSYGLGVLESSGAGFHQVPYVYSDFIQTGETATSTSYQDLTTVGPQVTVPVRSSGRILVFATAQMQYLSSTGANVTQGGVINVAMSGANTRSPVDANDPLVGIWTQNMIVSAGTDTFTNIITITASATFTGLTPGATTITMKYRRSSTAASNTDFFRRGLAVIAL